MLRVIPAHEKRGITVRRKREIFLSLVPREQHRCAWPGRVRESGPPDL